MRDDAQRAYQREWMRQWRAKNPERALAIGRKSDAKRRELVGQRFKYADNPEYWREHSRQWRRDNREKCRLLWYTWSKKNPEKATESSERYRARKNNATIEDCTERIEELRTCELCFWCGVKMKSVAIDHVIPLSRGGKHAPDNLVASCKTCNSSKYNKLVSEWRPVEHFMTTPQQLTQVT